MFPSPSLRLPVTAGILLVVLSGCGSMDSCRSENREYLAARERPRLQMPEGVSGSERVGGTVLSIPPVSPTPDKLDPAPRCLDEPPAYSRKPLTGSPVAPAKPVPPKAAEPAADQSSGKPTDPAASDTDAAAEEPAASGSPVDR